jgi:3-phenylpropionate/trans-cinnamate dioxygenase ferredoxin reductase component
VTAGFVVVGGGLAGQRCIQTLRSRGYDGRLTLVGSEAHLPYDRPPLSKELLAGEAEPGEIELRPESWYAERDVELLLGRAAVDVRPREHRLVLDDGATLRYDRLLVATGSRPRRLGALDGACNVPVLRTRDESLALRDVLVPGARLAIVGGGFIGQEVAATARRFDVAVTIVEAAPLPLERMLGARLGRWLARMHAEEGVDVRLSTSVERVQGNGRVEALELAGGERVEADAVLVGIGIEPATGWLRGSGLGPGPVRVDAAGATNVPDVLAAGDVAGGQHWDAAARQGVAAAHGMLGLEPPAPAPATFWSDQYGVRLQLVGSPAGHDRVDLHGDPASRAFHAVFRRAGRPVAGLAVGCPHELPRLRRLVNQSEAEVIV